MGLRMVVFDGSKREVEASAKASKRCTDTVKRTTRGQDINEGRRGGLENSKIEKGKGRERKGKGKALCCGKIRILYRGRERKRVSREGLIHSYLRP